MQAEDEVETSPCVGCGRWLPDFDGFGVVAHVFPEQVPEAVRHRVEFDENPCGYCRHLSRDKHGDWWVCTVCGHKRNDDGVEIPSYMRFVGDTRCEYAIGRHRCQNRAAVVLVTSDGSRTFPLEHGQEPAWGFGVVCASHGHYVIEMQKSLGREWHAIAAVIR